MRNSLIFLLLIAFAFTSWRLSEVENQRYALLLGMCPSNTNTQIPDLKCLDKVETRTSWIWNLIYGLKG
jgi:hypothetical protein